MGTSTSLHLRVPGCRWHLWQALWHCVAAADQVPLMEDLEQIFLRSWRESHLTEIRQYQQAPPQPFPPAPSPAAPVTSAQLPWLASLAASSCNDSVHVIECAYSLAEGLSEMFRLLVEGKLAKTNYVVIICACRSAAIDSCIAVTGERWAARLRGSPLNCVPGPLFWWFSPFLSRVARVCRSS